MYVVVAVERFTSPSVDSAVGLVGTYNTYEDAHEVMGSLFDHFSELKAFEERECGDMHAYLDDNGGTEYHWFIFDAENPEWFINY